GRLREYCASCERERTVEGAAAFAIVQDLYGADVAALKERVGADSDALDSAFAFLADVFGDGREMAAFVAELTARTSTARFIAQFGSETYYAHNASVSGGAQEDMLLSRIEKLDLEAAAAEAAKAAAPSCGSGCGGGCC
ncbi:MAG: hypothetical protein IJH04_06780, partial [Eggerthellaceae bacterium]|nr:hypothetical protein [Eggerthellaceae bacterium]